MSFKLGFLGVAHPNSYRYASALVPDWQACIWDQDVARLTAFADETHLAQAASAEKLIEQSDAIVLGCETNSKTHWIRQCNKPILSTFPLGLESFEAGEHWIMPAFRLRYSPVLARAKERLLSGEIGAVKAVTLQVRSLAPREPWRFDCEKGGGGALIDLGGDALDLVSMLLDEKPSSAKAQTTHRLLGQAVEDAAIVTLDFASGIFATVDCGWSKTGEGSSDEFKFNIVGETGVLELNLFAQELDVSSLQPSNGFYGSSLDRLMLQDFVQAVQSDKPSPIAARDASEALRLIQAAYASE